MKDMIPVYHADDIFEDMDQEIVDLFWERLVDVSYGDAEYTLIKGKDAYDLINAASREVADRRGGASAFVTPADLMEDGVFFAIRG